jgi:threonylcarbamoyladenosine tRNA methylthiotransferase MtaB
MSHRSNRTVALTTLGCKVNQADSDEWLRRFVERGYEVVDFDSVADAYVVNTCTVTHVADRKSRQLLRQARRQNPAAVVVAAGCYASVSTPEVAALPEVDLVVRDADKPRLVDLVHERLEGEDEVPFESLGGASALFGARHRGIVKIADGCDKFCAFCIVPYARGRARSVAPDQVLASVRRLVAAGSREVVLTAVHMGSYGSDLDPQISLRDLVRRVLAETAVERLRLSSIEPEDFDDELLPIWSEDVRLCRHVHLALDSGCDETLTRMRRRYRADEFEWLVGRIRAAIPGVAVTTDVIVGFPGETEREFAASHAFVERLAFAAIHVFPYSVRRRTSASKFPDQVLPPTKRERAEVMLELAEASSRRFRERFVGQTVSVLYEGSGSDVTRGRYWEGLTDNYLRVRAYVDADLTNAISRTRLVDVIDGFTRGELIEPPTRARVTAPGPARIPLPVLSAASR